MEITSNYVALLDIEGFSIEDIIITGSMANYTYTDKSDIDLNIICDYSELPTNCLIWKIFFITKKMIKTPTKNLFWGRRRLQILKIFVWQIVFEEANDSHNRIYEMHKTGLFKGDEFAFENLLFKALRNIGYLDKLRSYISYAEDLSNN